MHCPPSPSRTAPRR
ncbi:MAG: hypothetical protein IPM99_15710 [Rubrivivax sp.]|nr:hypothetical protein [Rubrivivax sp.]